MRYRARSTLREAWRVNWECELVNHLESSQRKIAFSFFQILYLQLFLCAILHIVFISLDFINIYSNNTLRFFEWENEWINFLRKTSVNTYETLFVLVVSIKSLSNSTHSTLRRARLRKYWYILRHTTRLRHSWKYKKVLWKISSKKDSRDEDCQQARSISCNESIFFINKFDSADLICSFD